MSFFNPNRLYKDINYRHKVMMCIIISQFILIGVFRFWPSKEISNERIVYDIPDQEFFVEEIIQTKQETAPAAPPKPQIPVPVPDEQIIEDEIELLDFEDMLSLDEIGENEIGQVGNSDAIVGSPEQVPNPRRIVEPNTPEAAKKAGVKVEVHVTFLVDKNGEVEEVFISKIKEYDEKRKRYVIVNEIGYNIMGVTLTAAQKWRFNPARDNGKPVKAYSTQVFSFGF